MKAATVRGIVVALLGAALLHTGIAQTTAGSGSPQRMQGGGINYAPQPAVYTVTMVSVGARTISLRAADGRTGVVNVGEAVYDLSKLKAGDKVRVDFIAPVATQHRLSAASIWPEK